MKDTSFSLCLKIEAKKLFSLFILELMMVMVVLVMLFLSVVLPVLMVTLTVLSVHKLSRHFPFTRTKVSVVSINISVFFNRACERQSGQMLSFLFTFFSYGGNSTLF